MTRSQRMDRRAFLGLTTAFGAASLTRSLGAVQIQDSRLEARPAAPSKTPSTGTQDEVLPINNTSRVITPRLRAAGYDVLYREFDGPHQLPPEIAREAFAWLVK